MRHCVHYLLISPIVPSGYCCVMKAIGSRILVSQIDVFIALTKLVLTELAQHRISHFSGIERTQCETASYSIGHTNTSIITTPFNLHVLRFSLLERSIRVFLVAEFC